MHQQPIHKTVPRPFHQPPQRLPDWLAAAYRRLDATVFTAYGWLENLADEEILARLLALNLARAGR